MTRIYVPSSGPHCWQPLLAKPELHWKEGFSAHCIAHAWEAAIGLPPEVARLFSEAGGTPELLLALPEHQVSLPGGSTNSQADVFALLRIQERTCAMAVERKVNEPFGPTISEWMTTYSAGKETRLRFVTALLGLSYPPAPDLRYQLFHRTASAVIEAGRFKTDAAAMIVHSFSPTRMWFEDFARFLAAFGHQAVPDQLFEILLQDKKPLFIGWASGDHKFRSIESAAISGTPSAVQPAG